MRLAKIVFLWAAALALLGISAVVGLILMLPSERSFANEIEINAPGEVVWQVINDRGMYADWQPALGRIEVVDGQHWVEFPKSSPEPLKFSVASDDQPHRMQIRYTMGDSFEGGWEGEISPTSTGIKLKTLDSYSTKDPFSKLMVWMFFDLDKFAKEWNRSLKARAENLSH